MHPSVQQSVPVCVCGRPAVAPNADRVICCLPCERGDGHSRFCDEVIAKGAAEAIPAAPPVVFDYWGQNALLFIAPTEEIRKAAPLFRGPHRLHAETPLIAAADELAAGLEHMQHCRSCGEGSWEDCDGGRSALAVLAKARGGR